MSRVWALQGTTVEKKLDEIEVILRRLLRRTPQTSTVVIPPIPFCVNVDKVGDTGLVARMAVPLDARVVALQAHVGFVADKVKPILTVTARGAGVAHMVEIPFKLGATSTKLDLVVSAGTLVEITTDHPESVGELSLGLLLEISVARAVKEKHILDSILDDEEKRNA